MRLLSFTLLLLATAAVTTAEIDPARLAAAGDNAPAIRDFAGEAAREFGDPGATAAAFLVAGMPAADLRVLTKDFLGQNLRLAFHARETFPWAKQVPDELFLDCVLPYAQLDEPRDPWRPEFRKTCGDIVKDCTTATDAVQMLNRLLFKQLGVKYSTQRKRANQSPRESIEQGLASCTGLSIILADACRSVGIPARIAGTAMWTNKRGNHTWVEVWDGAWHFTGASEPSPDGLDHGWFNGDASKAVADDPTCAIWANMWGPAKDHFPLVWNPADHSVPAVNVTARYTGGARNISPDSAAKPATTIIHLRMLDDDGQRVATRVEVLDKDGRFLRAVTTKAGTTDFNDMPAVELQPATACLLRVVRAGQARDFPLAAMATGDHTLDLTWSQGKPLEESPGMRALRQWLCQPATDPPAAIPPAALTKSEAAAAIDLVWDFWRTREAPTRAAEMKNNLITLGDKSMRLLTRVFGAVPADGRSLWISMHGGGGAPAHVNDQQWQNQIRLYAPPEGLYIAPRAPTNNWNLWHEGHIDDLFDRLVDLDQPVKVLLNGKTVFEGKVPRQADAILKSLQQRGDPSSTASALLEVGAQEISDQ